jgi:hypothetical protein
MTNTIPRPWQVERFRSNDYVAKPRLVFSGSYEAARVVYERIRKRLKRGAVRIKAPDGSIYVAYGETMLTARQCTTIRRTLRSIKW